MDQLHALLARHHIELTLVVYPWPDQVMHHDIDSVHVRLWAEWAAGHGVRFINLFPDFIRDGQDPKAVIAEYYIEGDVHFNEKGYQIVGRRLIEELQPLVPGPRGAVR
jgi:lysophospholipase L1-like esterase